MGFFRMMRGWVASLIVHVTLVALTGFERNMSHIVLRTDNLLMILGFAGIAVVIATWVVAHYTSWKFPRLLQPIQKAISQPIPSLLSIDSRQASGIRKSRSPRASGLSAGCPNAMAWKQLSAGNFREFELMVGGLVERGWNSHYRSLKTWIAESEQCDRSVSRMCTR